MTDSTPQMTDPTTPPTPPTSTPVAEPPPPGPRLRPRRRWLRSIAGPVELAIRALLVANVVVIGLLLVVVVTSLPKAPGHPDQESPADSIDLMSMGLAHIPTSASCLLCHETGGSGGLKPIPAIGHPLEGWRRCVTCHTNPELGRTAPGHTDIPEEECLNCHRLPIDGPTITQPHSRLQEQDCLSCHGDYAHLPTSMVEKDETECWLCHKPAELPPPEYPHVRDVAIGCRECHTSPQSGNLPIDHARYDDAICLLCHDIRTETPRP